MCFQDDSSLGTGWIILIVLASAGGIAAIGIGIWYVLKKRREGFMNGDPQAGGNQGYF